MQSIGGGGPPPLESATGNVGRKLSRTHGSPKCTDRQLQQNADATKSNKMTTARSKQERNITSRRLLILCRNLLTTSGQSHRLNGREMFHRLAREQVEHITALRKPSFRERLASGAVMLKTSTQWSTASETVRLLHLRSTLHVPASIQRRANTNDYWSAAEYTSRDHQAPQTLPLPLLARFYKRETGILL